MSGPRWQQKPPVGTQIDWSHPLATGLVWHAPLNEGSGTAINDLVGRNNLATTGAIAWSGGSAPGLSVPVQLGTVGAGLALPTQLQLKLPITLVVAFRPTGSTSLYDNIFGLFINNTGYPGSAAAHICYNSSNNQLCFRTQSAALYPSTAIPTGSDNVAVGILTANGAQIYLNGVQIASSSGGPSNPTYAATAGLALGYAWGTANYCANSLLYYASVYNVAPSAAFIKQYFSNVRQINQLYRPALSISQATLAPHFSVTPLAIPANHAGNITLTLAGTDRFWSGSPFSISGVSGVNLVSQNVTSNDSATLVVTTGSGTGTLAVSDGSLTAPVSVNAATFTITPSTGIQGVPYSVSAIGSAGSLWTHENAATLFSTPGTHGDSISSITVTGDQSAIFTLNPGTATGNLTITQGPTGATQNFNIVAQSSLRVTTTSTPWYASTAPNTLLGAQSRASYSLFFKINSGGTSPSTLVSNYVAQLLSVSGVSASQMFAAITDSASATKSLPSYTYVPGVVYHLAMTWNGTNYTYYLDGQVAATGSDTNLTTTNVHGLTFGWTYSTASDFYVQDIAVWNGYALSQTEVRKLRDRTITPQQTGATPGASPATTWLPLYGPQGNTPLTTDIGMGDVQGNNPITTFSGSATGIAKYSSSLTYIPPATAFPYVTKTGQSICFGFYNTLPTVTTISTAAGTGTVSVAAGSNVLTTSIPQSAWIGKTITINGDSSAGTYTIYSGSGKSYLISPNFGGSSSAVNANAQLSVNAQANVTTVASAPTVAVQFGGTGSFRNVQIGGQYFSPVNHTYPFVLFPLQCGFVKQAIIQNPGANYSSPTASVSGGGGSGFTVGTPLLTGGVTSYTQVSGGHNYTSTPTVTILPPTISLTGTLTTGSTSVTGLSSTAGLLPGMMVTGATAVATTIASVSSTTAITLAAAATVPSGSTSLTFHGRPALATPVISGGVITGLSVFHPGTGYTGSTVSVSISGGGGSGASFTATISQTIGYIPVTAQGSGYTSPPAITITDGGSGTGATAVALMGGLTPSDVVQYTAADAWVTTASGPCAAALNASVPNYTGQSEPGFSGFLGFNLPANQQTIQLGNNIAGVNYNSTYQNLANWITRAGVRYMTNVSSWDLGARPLTVTGTLASPTTVRLSIPAGTDIPNDYNNPPEANASGVNGAYWTYIADELLPNGPLGQTRMTLQGTSGYFTSLSSNGLPFIAGTATTGVMGPATSPKTLTLVSGGTGYVTPPTVVFTGGGGSGARATAYINSNGNVVWVTLISPGSGYTSAPTISFSGGGGSGASATAQIGPVTIGNVWQFKSLQSTRSYVTNPTIALWKSGATGSAYPHSLTNECMFSPQTAAAYYPAIPDRSLGVTFDNSPKTCQTSATPKYPGALRPLTCILSPVAYASNIVDPCDMRFSDDYAWTGDQLISNTIVANHPTFSRTINITNVRTYANTTAGLGWITVTSLGSGYTGTIPLFFTGGGTGTGAAGYASVSSGVVTSVTMTSSGSGYPSSATVFMEPIGGSGAVLTPNLSAGAITSVTVTNGGSGYYSTTPITITDSTGTGATAYAVVSPAGTISDGRLAAFVITNAGSGYSSAPTVTISGGGGSNGGATAYINSSGAVGSVLVGTAFGTGYNTTPSVSFSGGGGTGAAATARMSGVVVTAAGSNYTSPTASIVGNPGTGAAFSCSVGYPSGGIGGITVTSGGTGYTSAPTVTISDTGGGTGALAIANISGGKIVNFNIVATGSGYVSPTVSFSGGGGSGATATASVWNVTWSSPNVYISNHGTGGSTAVTADPAWTGYGATSPTSGGPYKITPPTVGWINPLQSSAAGSFCAELVTSAPHNLKSGQTLLNAGGTGTFSVAMGSTSVVTGAGISYGSPVWVTGPNTFVLEIPNGNVLGDGNGLPGHYSHVSGNFPVNYSATLYAPDLLTLSYDSMVKSIAQLPGTGYWATIPMAATDACVAAIATIVRDNLPKGRKVWVEYQNEHFNTVFNFWTYLCSMGALGAWGPVVPSSPSQFYLNNDWAFTLRTSQIHDIFVNVFNQTDINGNTNRGGEIVRLFGSMFVSPGMTSDIVNVANVNGIKVDAICIADYNDVGNESTSPTVAASVAVSSASGTLSTGAYYVAYTWVDGVSGIETDVGASAASFTIASSGQVATVTLPSFPSWGTVTANIYCTAAGGASGTWVQVASGLTSTTYTIARNPTGSTAPPAYNLMSSFMGGAALTATQWPTSLAYGNSKPIPRASYIDFVRHAFAYSNIQAYYNAHQAVLNQYNVGSYPIPVIGVYEASNETLVPTGVQTAENPLFLADYLRAAITADLTCDPAIYDCEKTIFLIGQQGGATLQQNSYLGGTGFGTAQGNVDGNYAYAWPYMLWPEQPMGKGDGSLASNGQNVTNIFWGDTGLDPHNQDTSPRMQAWNDWVDASSPLIVPNDLWVTPANGSTNASPRTVIVVEFNEPMLGSTLNATNWTVKLNGNSVTGTIAYNSVTWAATFTPSGSLSPLATYTVQLTTGVKNAQGVPIANPITWAFTTGASPMAKLLWFAGLARRA